MRPPRRWLAWLLAPLRLLLALVILFEEWGWEPLQRAMAALARLPLVRRLEAAVRALPPAAALAVFLVPGLLLLPVKLGALWLIGRGQLMAGLVLVLAAKVLGTALAAWLLELTRPALLRLPWFAAAYARWLAWKAALLDAVRASAPWRMARRWRAALRQAWRRVLRP